MKYKDLREEYQWKPLLETTLNPDPFRQFEAWFEEAIQQEKKDPNAMVLSTLSSEGFPQGRVVLLKEIDHGFIWFTNYDSRKGQDLDFTNKASLTFWWPSLERQVRINGLVEKISPEDSDRYFLSRPLGSQAGAIASLQSQLLENREILEERYANLVKENQAFVRPENWGGYRLVPVRFEFWQGRESRLHDRLVVEKAGDDWKHYRLYP
jgi:pyridoxamine 5'-phosphate oxidase